MCDCVGFLQIWSHIDRKKENAIFAPPQLCAAFVKQDDFGVDTPANVSTPNTKFERNRFKRSRDMRLQKLA